MNRAIKHKNSINLWTIDHAIETGMKTYCFYIPTTMYQGLSESRSCTMRAMLHICEIRRISGADLGFGKKGYTSAGTRLFWRDACYFKLVWPSIGIALPSRGLGTCPLRKMLLLRLSKIDSDTIWEVKVTNVGICPIISLIPTVQLINLHITVRSMFKWFYSPTWKRQSKPIVW